MVLSKRERYIVLVMVAAVALFAIDRIFIEPLIAQIKDLDTKVAAARTTLGKDQKLISTAKQKTRTWNDRLATTLKRVQSEADSQVFNGLREWAQDTRLNLSSAKSERVEKERDFSRISMRATGSGSMNEISQFLYRIQTARIPVRISELQLASKKEGVDELSLTLGLSTVYLGSDADRRTRSAPRENQP